MGYPDYRDGEGFLGGLVYPDGTPSMLVDAYATD